MQNISIYKSSFNFLKELKTFLLTKEKNYKKTDLFVAGHDNDLNLALHHHPPEVVDGVGEGTLAGNISITTTGT